MATGNTPRVIPNRQCWCIRQALNVVCGKVHAAIRSAINVTSYVVPLIIAAQEKRLTLGQIHVKPGDVGVQACWCLGVEAEASSIQPITNSRVIDRIAKSGSGKNGQRRRIHAGSLTICCQVTSVNLSGPQTGNTGRSTGRTGWIGSSTGGAIPNNSLPQSRKRHFANDCGLRGLAKTLVIKEEENFIFSYGPTQ